MGKPRFENVDDVPSSEHDFFKLDQDILPNKTRKFTYAHLYSDVDSKGQASHLALSDVGPKRDEIKFVIEKVAG